MKIHENQIWQASQASEHKFPKRASEIYQKVRKGMGNIVKSCKINENQTWQASQSFEHKLPKRASENYQMVPENFKNR